MPEVCLQVATAGLRALPTQNLKLDALHNGLVYRHNLCDVRTFIRFIGQLNCLNKHSRRSCQARSLQYVYLLIGAASVEAACGQM